MSEAKHTPGPWKARDYPDRMRQERLAARRYSWWLGRRKAPFQSPDLLRAKALLNSGPAPRTMLSPYYGGDL